MQATPPLENHAFVNSENTTVCAIIVTYNPNINDFLKLFNSLISQVNYVIVVDNFSLFDVGVVISDWVGRNVELLQMRENVGIATAQNLGIERAIDLDFDYVLLSDQDSIPSNSMVTELLMAMITANKDSANSPVAAVGPATVDSRTGAVSFFAVERFGIPCRWNPSSHVQNSLSKIEVSFLIASGTLISVDAIKCIGVMRSNYFIDHVDTEWCFRAKAAGYRLMGVPNSRLKHKLGDDVRKVWFFGFRHVMYHSPLRDYYIFRNTLLMLRDAPMSLMWRMHFLWRLIQFAIYFLIFSINRRERFHMMILGLLHGFKGVGGRFEPKADKF